MLDMNEIRSRIKQIGDLPSLPMIVSYIVNLVKNPKTSAADITKIIQMDPALTAKVLKLVNSAYYGFPREISSLNAAITILGFNDVKNLALSATVFEIFKDDAAVQFSRQELWAHSVAVAVTGRILANSMKYRDPEEVFIAGILHDIGKIVFDTLWHDLFVEIIDRVQSTSVAFRHAEVEVAGFSHAEVGAVLCEHWNLPPGLCQAVQFHHYPALSSPDVFPLTAFIHAADVFTKIKKIGFGGDDVVPRMEKEVWYFLKLKPDDLDRLYDRIDDEVVKAESFLKISD